MTSPVKLYAPDELAVMVAVAAPPKVTVAPFPPVPLITPEIVNVVAAAELKFTAVTLPPLTVTFWLVGVKVKPVFVGVTV